MIELILILLMCATLLFSAMAFVAMGYYEIKDAWQDRKSEYFYKKAFLPALYIFIMSLLVFMTVLTLLIYIILEFI